MYELTFQSWLIALGCVATVGMSKAGMAGVSILAIPVMADLFPARVSMGILLPLLIVGDVFAVLYYHRHADWGIILRLIPPAFSGVIIGALIMNRISDSGLRVGVGVIVLLMVVLSVLRSSGVLSDERIPRGTVFSLAAGLLAGVTTMLAHAAGPVVLVYLLTMDLKKNRFIGTMAWFFLLLNSFKVPFYAGLGLVNAESLLLNLKLVPGIPVGVALGVLILKMVSNRAYTVWIQVLAGVAAVRLILS